MTLIYWFAYLVVVLITAYLFCLAVLGVFYTEQNDNMAIRNWLTYTLNTTPPLMLVEMVALVVLGALSL